MNKNVKKEVWVRIFREMYPDWDEKARGLRNKIGEDVKNRWRSLRDQFRRYENAKEQSGSSPISRRRFAYYESLLFLRSGRELRPSSGNVGDTNQPEDEETITLDSSPSMINTEDDPPLESNQAASGGPSTSHIRANLQRGRHQSREGGFNVNRQNFEFEALSMLQRVEKEDEWDHLACTLASRLRKLPVGRQWHCVPILFEVVEIFNSPNPIPTNLEIITELNKLKQSRCQSIHSAPHVAPQSSATLSSSEDQPHMLSQPSSCPASIREPSHVSLNLGRCSSFRQMLDFSPPDSDHLPAFSYCPTNRSSSQPSDNVTSPDASPPVYQAL
ncbi:uncharacterized protein LOC130360705 [Hyla sarda]|uniref:uncharacterized protein LOC130360705 n=1 Tax=Hyla sarda TaxID=327740 RepID=UPI0024C3C1E5|nr:uncharacterized protein LOC130360705 [Hyla sarda]